MAHIYTQAEVLQLVVEYAAEAVQTQLTAAGLSTQERLEGLALNLFELFDGQYPGGFPLCVVATNPDAEIQAQSLAAGYDQYPTSELSFGVDCGGLLSSAWLESLG